MTVEILNHSPVTFEVSTGNTYCVDFPSGYDLTIANNSDGDLYVATDNSFEFKNGVGSFLIIPSYTAVFNYERVIYAKNQLYFYADGNGKVSIIQN